MLIKGQDVSKIKFGNTLSDDGLPGETFDYMLSNPPFGVEWKKVEKTVRAEAEQKGFAGRFGPGLPRVSDGSLLFLMHLLSKMRAAGDGGSRFGIVLNGSPLFTGGAGSGESEIRRYVLENDLVEAIIAGTTPTACAWCDRCDIRWVMRTASTWCCSSTACRWPRWS